MNEWPGMKKLLESPALQTQLHAFSMQFPTVSVTKATGRTSAPVKTAVWHNELAKLFAECMSNCRCLVKDAPADSPLVFLEKVALFGYMGWMVYYNFEERGSTVRYVVTGSRELFCLRASNFIKAYTENGFESCVSSMSGLLEEFKNLLGPAGDAATCKKVVASSGDQLVLWHAAQKAGESFYLPAGWLVAERVLSNQPVVGLRYSFLPAKDECNAMSGLLQLCEKSTIEADRNLPVCALLKAVVAAIS
jgi:hypothetical protein